ncbi:MAG: hypothetical protein HY716_05915 [Planctomycetes bacterium]|nr:hypothetical protein [Planctomycetota bacterium]
MELHSLEEIEPPCDSCPRSAEWTTTHNDDCHQPGHHHHRHHDSATCPTCAWSGLVIVEPEYRAIHTPLFFRNREIAILPAHSPVTLRTSDRGPPSA